MEMARRALEEVVKKGKPPVFNPSDAALLEPAPCFVTLYKKGELRGCVGILKAEKPLFEEVVRMTWAAASEDFRFQPIRPEELGEIEIEISVLSPLEKIASPHQIEVGRHGVYLRWKDKTGAFLPEVAVEQGWNAEEFFEACAREKAMIPKEAWPETALYRFTTQKIKA